jgi:hypothetical protein
MILHRSESEQQMKEPKVDNLRHARPLIEGASGAHAQAELITARSCRRELINSRRDGSLGALCQYSASMFKLRKF